MREAAPRPSKPLPPKVAGFSGQRLTLSGGGLSRRPQCYQANDWIRRAEIVLSRRLAVTDPSLPIHRKRSGEPITVTRTVQGTAALDLPLGAQASRLHLTRANRNAGEIRPGTAGYTVRALSAGGTRFL